MEWLIGLLCLSCVVYSHFFKNLQPCLHNPANLGPLIEKSRVKLRQYIIYCQNKPVSEHIVAEHFNYFEEIRNKLKHKLVVSGRVGGKVESLKITSLSCR